MDYAAVVGVGHQLKAMGDSTAAGGERAQGAGGVHPASWGSQRCRGRAGGWLKPDVKATVGGDRPPRLGGDAVSFEDMCVFLVVGTKLQGRAADEEDASQSAKTAGVNAARNRRYDNTSSFV